MTDAESHRNAMEELCRIEPEDGPAVCELKSILTPPLVVPDFVPEQEDVDG